MCKKSIQLCLFAVLFCSGISIAGLQLQNSIAEINTKIYSWSSSLIFEKSGQVSEYVDLARWTTTDHYVRATNSISISDDKQHIRNNFYSNTCGFMLDYVFAYDSAITFFAENNETGQQAIIVTAGDLYLNNSKLERELDGSYLAPTGQNIIAVWTLDRIAPQSNNWIYQSATAPVTTSTQDIYLQGYTVPLVIPEPATMGILSIGSLLFAKRRK